MKGANFVDECLADVSDGCIGEHLSVEHGAEELKGNVWGEQIMMW
jgi:hypothetical protein